MRHRKSKYKINRYTSWRKATFRSMVMSLFKYESINTTLIKAKAVRPLAEKMITLAKLNTLDAKRRAFEVLADHDLVKKLFEDIGPRFAKKNGGYVRILHLGVRRGDNAKLAVFQLTELKEKAKKSTKEAASKVKEIKDDKEVIEISKVDEKPVATKKTSKTTKEKEVASDAQTDSKSGKKFLGGIKKIFNKKDSKESEK